LEIIRNLAENDDMRVLLERCVQETRKGWAEGQS
jgi:hypothetical protein